MAHLPSKITIRREPSRLHPRALRFDRLQVLAGAATALVAFVGALVVWAMLSGDSEPEPIVGEPGGQQRSVPPRGNHTALRPPIEEPPVERIAETETSRTVSSAAAEELAAACDDSIQRTFLDWLWNTGGFAVVDLGDGLQRFVANQVAWRSAEPLLAPGELPAGPLTIRGVCMPGGANAEQLQRCLEAAPNLQTLALDAEQLDSDALLAMRNLAELRDVSLGGWSATRADLEIVSEFPALRRLHLAQADLTRDALEGLGQCTQLNELCLANASFDLGQLVFLSSLPGLSQVDLRGTDLDDASIEILARLQPLKRLHLDPGDLSPQGLERLHEALPQCDICPGGDADTLGPAFWPQLAVAPSG
jgi:hypothetical protein